MKPSFHILPSGISLSFDGKVLTIPKGDRRHEKLMNAIREERYDDIPEIVEDLERYFARHEGVEFVNGQVLVDGAEVSGELNHYILGLAELGIPFDRMVKFWRRMVQSERYGPRQRLFSFLQHNGHPIAEDGRFLAYRRVKEFINSADGEGKLRFPNKPEGERILIDLYSGTIDNSVGEIPSMNPADVDDDPNRTCSAGLHAANFSYAKDMYSDGVLIEIAIAPEDVITVPVDYEGMKMRTCKYEIIAEIEGPRSGPAVNLNEGVLSPLSDDDIDDGDDYDDDECNTYD